MKLERHACIGIAALAYAIVGACVLFFWAHPEHDVTVEVGPFEEVGVIKHLVVLGPSSPVEVQEPIPHKPVQEYEVE